MYIYHVNMIKLDIIEDTAEVNYLSKIHKICNT